MKRIVVTRPRTQADGFLDALRVAGFEPICLPVIEIRPMDENPELDAALARLNEYAWIVFTSINGVEVVLKGLPAAARLPRVAAIGPKTAQALRERGIVPDFVPEEYVAESILPGLGDVRGQKILLARAEIARKALPDAIRAAGGTAHEIAVYITIPVEPDADGLQALRDGVDWLTFTSPSTVENFVAVTRSAGLDPLHLAGHPKVACIGPITERAAREAGFDVDLVAADYTTEGLTRALRQAESRVQQQ